MQDVAAKTKARCVVNTKDCRSMNKVYGFEPLSLSSPYYTETECEELIEAARLSRSRDSVLEHHALDLNVPHPRLQIETALATHPHKLASGLLEAIDKCRVKLKIQGDEERQSVRVQTPVDQHRPKVRRHCKNAGVRTNFLLHSCRVQGQIGSINLLLARKYLGIGRVLVRENNAACFALGQFANHKLRPPISGSVGGGLG